MSKAIVVGGGIIGLSSALYLERSGWQVTVLDKGDFTDNCSFGNAGYICPSHFVPLATPGIVNKGLRWMFNSRSPFYVQPRLNGALLDWARKFMQSANPQRAEAAAIPLRDIALVSQREYEQWAASDFEFSYEHKGLLEIFQSPEGEAHAHHLVDKALALGLAGTRLLSPAELRQMEPFTDINASGAIFFPCDAHCYPNKLMKNLLGHLQQHGVTLVAEAPATGFEAANGTIAKVITPKSSYDADVVVLAAGAWSRNVARMLSIKIPLVAGRGYSVTLENSPFRVNYPAILVEGRVAITPMDGNKIRFGGTMEITGVNTPPRMQRVQGILSSVKKYYPLFNVPMPRPDAVWYGYRPCSADGLPYIGRTRNWKNLVLATGHAMLGLSLGAGTGKLVAEIINEQETSMDIRPFAVERFERRAH